MKPCMLRTSIQKSPLSACDTAAVWFRGFFFSSNPKGLKENYPGQCLRPFAYPVLGFSNKRAC